MMNVLCKKNTLDKSFKITKDNFELGLLVCLPFYVILKLNFISVFIILIPGYVLLCKRDFLISRIKKTSLKTFFLTSAWYLFLLVTLLYSQDKASGVKIAIRGSGLLIIPFFIIYGFNKIDELKKSVFFYSYTIVIFVFLIILNVQTFIAINFFFPETPANYNVFLKYSAYELLDVLRWYPEKLKINFHRTYFCFSFLVCISFWLDKLLFRSAKKGVRILSIIIISILTFCLFFYFSIANIIAFGVLVVFFLIMYIKKNNLKLKYIGLFILPLTLGVVFLFQSSYVKSQITKLQGYNSEIVNLFDNSPTNNVKNSRVRLAKVAVFLIKQEPLFGYGIGDVKKELLKEYKNRDYKIEYAEEQNTHNYYFHLLLSGGLVLLLIFITSFSFLFSLSIKNRDIVFFSFLVIFLINLFSENFLSRIYGIFSFSLFISLFIKYNE